MDGGMAATAPPSHSHHLDSPFVTRPPPTSHLMLIVASSPLHRQQRADKNTLASSSPHQRATAPPPPRLDKILSIDKRRQTTYGVRRWCAAVASKMAAAGSCGVRQRRRGGRCAVAACGSSP
jgi:hypothetical protein